MMKIKSKRSKNQNTSHLLTGSLIIAFMLFIPYAFYIYRSFPEGKTFAIGNYTFVSNYYESVRYFFHAFFSKLIPLTLLLIWFTTCKHWWYYSIAIPISVYIFQLISVVNDDIGYVDKYEFVYSLPFTIIILGVLYYIRTRISIYLKAVNLKTHVDEVIDKGIKKRDDFLKEKGYD